MDAGKIDKVIQLRRKANKTQAQWFSEWEEYKKVFETLTLSEEHEYYKRFFDILDSERKEK